MASEIELLPPTGDTGGMQPRQVKLVKWLIGTAVAAIFLWLFAAADYNAGNLWPILKSPAGVGFLLQSIMSIALGVLSAIFFSSFENKQAQARIDAIRSVAPGSLVDSTLRFFREKRDQGYVYDESIEFILGPAQGHDKFLVMRVAYSYKKALAKRDLMFRFLFLKTDKDQQDAMRNQAAVDAHYSISESFVQYPDAHLRTEFGDELVDAAHRLVYVKLDGGEIQLSRVAGDPTLRYYRLPESTSLEVPIRLDYVYEFPVATSDVIFGVAECLTHGLSIKFIRDGSIRDQIEAEGFEIMSAVRGNPVIVEDPIGTHSLLNEGWVIPKSGAVFHWWPA